MKKSKKTPASIIIVIATLISLIAVSNLTVSAETTDNNLSNATPPYICGDADLDGKVSIKDATLIQMYVAKLETLDYIQHQVADCDDKVDVQIFDATTLQMNISKLLTDLPE